THSVDKALAILGGGTTDDGSERAARVLDRADVLKRLNAQQLETLGETMQNHRHFDRAIAILTSIPSPKPDTIFAIGRSYYGAEQYAQAEQQYVRAANAATVPAEKTQYLWHAARAAQLRSDDAAAEKWMNASIAI